MAHCIFSQLSLHRRANLASIVALLGLLCAPPAWSQAAYIRVNQVGYESGSRGRAYLMSTVSEEGATFSVIDSKGAADFSGSVGRDLGSWASCTATKGSGSKKVCSTSIIYQVYALDFNVPLGDIYTISVVGPATVTSPHFAVDRPRVLYPGLLLNTLFFYQTQRDGPNFIANALRNKPGHLKDEQASVYLSPNFDDNDLITNTGVPLISTGAVIDSTGGWWDAGDYMKYVETVSYTAALMEIGVRDFPNQMGPNAPLNPAAPPASVSYAGNSAGAPSSADFSAEAQFGVEWLMKMWDDQTQTLYYQTDNSQDWDDFPNLISEYDIWTRPQAADNFKQQGDPEPCDPNTTFFICNRPVFIAAPAGSAITPNLAGRLAVAFATYYQLNRTTNPNVANQALLNAEHIFALADTSLPDPADNLLTIAPFDGYGENVWDDDMELGATELYFALKSAGGARNLPAGLPVTDPIEYLQQAAQFANNYVTNVYDTGNTDTLNLYDLSGLAHFELYRALAMAGKQNGLAISESALLQNLTDQLSDAIAQAQSDVFAFGQNWRDGDTTSHGAGLSVMASEAHYLTQASTYDKYSKQWLGNILGLNSWGSSFIVGDGSTFPNCIQHQVANLVGALNGTSGGTPVLWGAASEGPGSHATSGIVGGMKLCPKGGVDTFAIFNGVDGPTPSPRQAVYQDNMQSYSTTEPAIDLTTSSFLMFSWRMAGRPSTWTRSNLSAFPSILSSKDHGSRTTLIATVVSTGSAPPAGRVKFYLGSLSGTLLGDSSLAPASGARSTAILQVRASQLPIGADKIVAYFAGDTDGPSTSFPVRVTVK